MGDAAEDDEINTLHSDLVRLTAEVSHQVETDIMANADEDSADVTRYILEITVVRERSLTGYQMLATRS